MRRRKKITFMRMLPGKAYYKTFNNVNLSSIGFGEFIWEKCKIKLFKI